MEAIKRPTGMPMTHWILCHIFAFDFAQHQGWFDGVKNYKDVSPDDYGYETYQQGLDIAITTYKFWTKNLKFSQE